MGICKILQVINLTEEVVTCTDGMSAWKGFFKVNIMQTYFYLKSSMHFYK